MKQKFENEDFVKEFSKVTQPDIKALEEIDENLRQFLFAQWILNNEDKSSFTESKEKLKSLIKQNYKYSKKRVELDPTQPDLVKSQIGELVSEVKYNETFTMNVVVPNGLRMALFEGWEEKGFEIFPLLYPFGE